MSRSFDGKRIKKEISSDEEGGRLSDGEVEEENFSADTVRRSRSRSRSRRRGRERTLKPEDVESLSKRPSRKRRRSRKEAASSSKRRRKYFHGACPDCDGRLAALYDLLSVLEELKGVYSRHQSLTAAVRKQIPKLGGKVPGF